MAAAPTAAPAVVAAWVHTEAALSAAVLAAVHTAEVPVVGDSVVAVLAAVRSAAALIAEDSAAVPVVVDSVAAVLAAVVPSAEVHTAVDTAVVATAAVAVAEWVDIGNSEHQFPDFSIRHLRNLAH